MFCRLLGFSCKRNVCSSLEKESNFKNDLVEVFLSFYLFNKAKCSIATAATHLRVACCASGILHKVSSSLSVIYMYFYVVLYNFTIFTVQLSKSLPDK